MATDRRNTKQQDSIRRALEVAGRPLSIEEVHAAASDEVASLGMRTVYRVVRRLEEDGVIAAVRVPGQPDRYERADVAAVHHHHFRCEACDRMFDLPGCPGKLEQMLPPGFQLTGHELTLTGRCSSCATPN